MKTLAIDEIAEKINDFIYNKNPTNTWIETDIVRLYTRCSHRKLNKETLTCLDIANIEVVPHLQGTGIFTAILEYMQDVCPWDGVYVECVNNPRLREHLNRRVETNKHWVKLNFENGGEANSFIWLKDIK